MCVRKGVLPSRGGEALAKYHSGFVTKHRGVDEVENETRRGKDLPRPRVAVNYTAQGFGYNSGGGGGSKRKGGGGGEAEGTRRKRGRRALSRTLAHTHIHARARGRRRETHTHTHTSTHLAKLINNHGPEALSGGETPTLVLLLARNVWTCRRRRRSAKVLPPLLLLLVLVVVVVVAVVGRVSSTCTFPSRAPSTTLAIPTAAASLPSTPRSRGPPLPSSSRARQHRAARHGTAQHTQGARLRVYLLQASLSLPFLFCLRGRNFCTPVRCYPQAKLQSLYFEFHDQMCVHFSSS